MAITPEIEDSRSLRFPKDWFKLPWHERNKKFNELINNELEKAKEFLNGLPQVSEEIFTESETKSTVEELPDDIPIVYSQDDDKYIEKVDACELIQELDRIIQKTENKKVKKKARNDKNYEDDTKEDSDPDRKEVKTLEEHLKEFLGPEERKERKHRKSMKRPPGRHGVRKCEVGSSTTRRFVYLAERRQPLLLKRRNPPPVTATPPPSPNELSPSSQAQMQRLAHAVKHGLTTKRQSWRVRTPRPALRPPARLPPIPPQLVPMVTLTIDDPEEHARELLSRRILEPPPPSSPSSNVSRNPATCNLTPPVRSAVTHVSVPPVSISHHTLANATTHNMGPNGHKTTVHSTCQNERAAANPSGCQTYTYSAISGCVRRIPSENVRSTVKYTRSGTFKPTAQKHNLKQTASSMRQTDSRTDTHNNQDLLEAVNLIDRWTDLNSVNSSIRHASSDTQAIRARYMDSDGALSRPHHDSSEMGDSTAQHAASGTITSCYRQLYSTTAGSDMHHADSKTIARLTHQDIRGVESSSGNHTDIDLTTPSVPLVSSETVDLDARREDCNIPYSKIRHAYSKFVGSHFPMSETNVTPARQHNLAGNNSMRHVGFKAAVQSTFQDMFGPLTPGGLQKDINSALRSERLSSSETVHRSVHQADCNVPSHTSHHVSAKKMGLSSQYPASGTITSASESIVAPMTREGYSSLEQNSLSIQPTDSNANFLKGNKICPVADSFISHQSTFHAAAPNIVHKSLDMNPLNVLHTNSNVHAPRVHCPPFNLITPAARHAASDPRVTNATTCHGSSEYGSYEQYTSSGMRTVSTTQSDSSLATPRNCHSSSEATMLSDYCAHYNRGDPSLYHSSPKTTDSGLGRSLPKVGVPTSHKLPSQMATHSNSHADFRTAGPIPRNAACEEGTRRLSVPSASKTECKAVNAPPAVSKSVSRFGYYQVM